MITWLPLLLIPSLVAAIPYAPPVQRPFVLDQVKDGTYNGSDLIETCFQTFNHATKSNERVCINTVDIVEPKKDGNPDFDTTSKSITRCGYIKFDDISFYFWIVFAENNPAAAPVVLWLNGGPGVSSLLGLFDQWGPRKWDHSDRKLVDNEFRLTEKLTWIFLEQPDGVGYTTPKDAQVDNSDDGAQDVLRFLQGVMTHSFNLGTKLPSVRLLGNGFHIAGESYAGHYIPAIGAAIVDAQARSLNLKSLIIGNGMIDVTKTSLGISDLFCGDNPILKAPTTNDFNVAERCDEQFANDMVCLKGILDCREGNNCDKSQTNCLNAHGASWAFDMGRDIYDFSKKSANEVARNVIFKSTMPNFFQQRKENFGIAADYAWEYTKARVSKSFVESGDWARSFTPEINKVLDNGIQVLLYAGDIDLAVPHTAVKRTAMDVNWNEQDSKGGSKREKFLLCLGKPETNWETLGTGLFSGYGKYVRVGRFAYAQISNAGHMINENSAKGAKDMFERWIGANDGFKEKKSC